MFAVVMIFVLVFVGASIILAWSILAISDWMNRKRELDELRIKQLKGGER